jgi:hypothetical protein
MLAQLGAILAAVRTVVERLFGTRFGIVGALAAAAITLGGCLPTTVPLARPDPADPHAKVAGVGYRSTVAPYARLRPTAPTNWRDQNDRVAPTPKFDR